MAFGDIDRGEGITGGIAAVREAFNHTAHGKFVCTQVWMTYDHRTEANAQVLELIGHQVGGAKGFRVTCPVPAGHSLVPAARAMAHKLMTEGSDA